MTTDLEKIPPEVLRQAAHWVWVLHTYKDPRPHLEDYAVWLNASEENDRAYLLVQQIWRGLDEAYTQGRLTEPDLVPPAVSQSPSTQRDSSRWIRSATLVCLLALTALGALLFQYPSFESIENRLRVIGTALHLVAAHVPQPDACRPPTACLSAQGHYASDYEHTRQLDLSDGSVVILNTNSQVTVDFKTGLRRVLLDRGEALFKVKKNDAAPFEVPVGSTIVESVGTVFMVERKVHDAAEVMVEQGAVRLHVNKVAEPYVLKQGDTATVDHGKFILGPPEPSQTDGRSAWVEGVVSLHGVTLAEAAERFNPYNRRQLVVDPDIASIPVNGIFIATNPEGFAEALEQLNGIHHSVTPDPATGVELIRLSKKALPGAAPIKTTDGKKLADRHPENEN